LVEGSLGAIMKFDGLISGALAPVVTGFLIEATCRAA
jgi:hypothetical protein